MLRFWRSSVVLVVIPAVLGVCLLGCGGGGGGGGGTGVSISAVEGDGATPQDIATKVIVTGSGFVDGDVVEILNTDDTPNNTGCLGTTFIDANTLELAVDPDTFESGDRKVAVVRGATVMATKANGFLTGPEGPQGIQGIQGIQGLPGNAYNAGPGIIVDTVPDPDVISVDLAGTGVLDTVARSDHDHDSTYYTQAAADLLLADEMDVLDYDTVTPGDGIVDDADHAALADLALHPHLALM